MQKLTSKSKFAALAGVNPSTVTRVCRTILKGALVGKKIDLAHPDALAYLSRQDEEATRLNPPQVATGLDPLYEPACEIAVKWVADNVEPSKSAIQRALRIGFPRAAKIYDLLVINGVIPPAPVITTAPPPPRPELAAHVPPKLIGNAAVKAAKKAAPPPNGYDGEIPEYLEAFIDYSLRDIILQFGTDGRFVDFLTATQKIEAINEKRLKNERTRGELISRELVKVGVIDIFNSAHLRLMKDGAKTISAGVISKHASGAELAEVEAFVSDILGSFIRPVKSKIDRALKSA